MRLGKPTRGGNDEINMAPMIDIVFLLIIFFMCVSQFTQLHLEKLSLPPAKDADDPEAVEQGPYLINIHPDGRIFMTGRAYTPESLETALLADTEKKEIDEIPPAIIRGDRALHWGKAARVMRICAKSRIGRIRVAVIKQ